MVLSEQGLLCGRKHARIKDMKSLTSLGIAMFALVSCRQTLPTADTPAGEDAPSEKPVDYQALPGKAATSATPSETMTAFEFAAAAYATAPTQQSVVDKPQPEAPRVAPPALPQRIRIPDKIPAAPPIPDPRPIDAPPRQVTPPTPAATTNGSTGISGPTQSSSVGYAVQVTNGTNGRLFVEVQDDSNNIFPFGFMYAGQRIAACPQESRPISGQLHVIIRDPDQSGAPELRRYHVNPPPSYEGRTLGITILPGGRYRASLDGEVYFRSPDPELTQPTG